MTQIHIAELQLCLPQIESTLLSGARHSMTDRQLQQVGASLTVAIAERQLDQRTAAVRLATPYRLDLWLVYDELQRLYGAGEFLPYSHLQPLRRQIEGQIYQRDDPVRTMVT